MYTRIVVMILGFMGCMLSSCGVYNFTGGSVPPDIKTISIQNIYNETGLGPTNLSQNITEKLKAYYQSNTKLLLTPSNGDWRIEGKITNYSTSGLAPKANETSALNSLNITVKINFTNSKDEKQNFDKDFAFFQTFDAQKNAFEVENELSNIILDQIVLDIFQKTTSNW